MEINIIETNNQKIAEIISDEIVIRSQQDALDIMGNASYLGAQSLIVHEKNLLPDFFELRTKFAGDILLKFTTYRVKLAIVGEFEKYESNSLQAFILESNRGNQLFFVPDRQKAIEKLSR